MEIVLIHKGRLSTTGHRTSKFELRRRFREQLITYHNHMIADEAPRECCFQPENQKNVGPFIFLPLVTKSSRQVVELDVTLLTESEPACQAVHPTGDIDNYLKALLDGLRMAQTQNEVRDEVPLQNETPFYCLLEDDQVVRRVMISHHKNLVPSKKKQLCKGFDVFALIKVKICNKYTSY